METSRCPICGAILKKPEDSYALMDAEICCRCRDDLRFQYPLIYLPRVGMLDDHPQCQNLRRKDLTYLRRNRRELELTTGDGSKSMSYCFDTMQLLTLSEFQKQLPGADARENQLRLDYDDYTNVLTVDYARSLRRTIGRPGVQNFHKRRKGFCVTGFIRAGAFHEGDLVGIRHQGRVRYAQILALDYEEATPSVDGQELRTGGAETLGDRGNQGRWIRAGYQVTLVLEEKAGLPEPGDWIVSD